MLNINKNVDGMNLTFKLEGRLDTMTSPELEETVNDRINNVEKLVFDLTNLEYISSAGLRVLLLTQKKMNKQGTMLLTNPQPEVKEIFEVTGFTDILNIR